MKKTTKRLGALILGLTLALGVFSCQPPAPDDDNIVRYEATLNASNTIPRATSSAVGAASLEYDKSAKTLRYNITFQGLTPNGGHIQIAPIDEPMQAKLIEFGNAPSSPITGSIPLRGDFESFLRFGQLYITLTTAENPEGEIRGAITPVQFGE